MYIHYECIIDETNVASLVIDKNITTKEILRNEVDCKLKKGVK